LSAFFASHLPVCCVLNPVYAAHQPALLEEVWERLVHYWLGRINWFAKTVADCYKESIGVTTVEVQAMCDKFLPTGAGPGRKRNYSFSKLSRHEQEHSKTDH
jgi:hypothetical protein